MTKYLLHILLAISGCSISGKTNSDSQDPISLYQSFPYKVGAAIDVGKLRTNPTYRLVATKEFNSFTPENALKFNRIQKTEGNYFWSDMDYMVDFAKKNGKRIHGHALIFDQATPDWVRSFNGNFDSLLTNYITKVVSHYKDIKSWDVVNEAFEKDGQFKQNIWFQKLGPNYIKKAFMAASRANPDALLFYNDNQLEEYPKKLVAIIQHLNKLRTQGVRIDGIGSQMHVKEYTYNQEQTVSSFLLIAKNNYLLHISELDVGMNKSGIKRIFLPNEISNQTKVYQEIIGAYQKVPLKQQFGVTFWGVSDADTWLNSYYRRNDEPLLFDKNYKVKSTVKDAIISILN